MTGALTALKRRILAALSCAITAATSSAQAQPLGGPIAQAADGRAQCYAPDIARKTCQSLAFYKADATGVIQNTAIVVLSPDQPITMQTTTPVTIRAEEVCGFIRAQDIDAATFAVNGVAVTGAQAAQLRAAMRSAMSSLFGHEICTAYVPNGAALSAQVSEDGVRKPAMDQAVIWVSPVDGYRVSP